MLLKKSKSLLKGIDIFGQPILLSFKGRIFYKTWAGGFLTFFLVASIIAFSFESIIALVLRANIKVAFSEIFEVEPPLIELSGSNGFVLAVGFTVDTLNNPVRKYFDIQAANIHILRYENGTKSTKSFDINLKICEKDDFPSDYDYLKNNHKNWLCIVKNETLSMSGKYYGSEFKYVRFSINRCVNKSTLGGICASKEEIDDALKQKVYLNFVFSNKIINIQDYEKPFINYIENGVFFLLDPLRSYKQADIFFQKQSISFDDNIFYYQSKETSEITYQNFRDQDMDLTSNLVGSFYLRSSSFRGVYIASSEKLTFMLARLGGLMSMLYNLMRIIIRSYTRRKLLISLSNFLYKFVIPKKNENTPEKFDHKKGNEHVQAQPPITKKKSIIFRNRRVANILIDDTERNSDIHCNEPNSNNIVSSATTTAFDLKIISSVNNYLDKFIKLNFNCLGFIFSKFRKKNENSMNFQMVNKTLKKINLDMDIIDFLNKNKEIERLKDFLFEKDEKTIFEFFQKPIIFLKNSHSLHIKDSVNAITNELLYTSKKLSNPKKQELYSHIELIKAYKKIQDTSPDSSFSEKSRRLISFIEEPLKSILKTIPPEIAKN